MDHRDRHPGNRFLRHVVTHHAVNVAIQRIMSEKFLSTFRGGHLRERATTAEEWQSKQKPVNFCCYVLHT